MIVLITIVWVLGCLELGFVLSNHVLWLTKRKERSTWPWNWRLLMPSTKYIDWRYDMYGYNGVRNKTNLFGVGLSPTPNALPQREQADPYVGYKTLALVIDEGRIRCKGCTGSIYDIEAVASCNIPTLYYGGITSGVLTVAQARAFVQALGQESAITDLTHKSPDPLCRCGFYALAERPGDWEYGVFMAQVELYGRVVRGERGWRAEHQRILRLEAKRVCPYNHQDDLDRSAVGFISAASETLIPVCDHHGQQHSNFMDLAELTGKIGTEVAWAA
jgi:hypothetical protein